MKYFEKFISENKNQVRKSSFPGFVSPMLATLTEDYFDDKQWIYERKLDGVRSLLLMENGEITLYSRNKKNKNETYPEIVEAFEDRDYPDLIVDGEIVAFDGNITSFSKLQGRMQLEHVSEEESDNTPVYYYVFDILYYNGYDLTGLPLDTRKKALKQLLHWDDPVRFTVHRNEKGKEYLESACSKGWEGVIAKDRRSTYRHSRSKKWLKFKCTKNQELVIGGFTEPQGERKGFGALLIGYYMDGDLQYAGKVGTGFDDAFLEKWRNKLDKITVDSSPFTDFQEMDEQIHWVKPKFVGQIGFTEWTDKGRLRHPRFLGIRDDKKAKEVVREKSA